MFCSFEKNGVMKRVYDKLSKEGGIWERHVVPSLFVGTRGVMSSVAAYAFKSLEEGEATTRRVREVMTMGADGAKLVLDWEIPLNLKGFDEAVVAVIQSGKVTNISRPVVLLVHGMNNDSSFGYIRSMMRTATSRGWVAICMNLRGQDWLGEVKNTTPRGVSYHCTYIYVLNMPLFCERSQEQMKVSLSLLMLLFEYIVPYLMFINVISTMQVLPEIYEESFNK